MPSPPELVVRSRRIVTPQGLVDGAVVVRQGRIEEVVPGDVQTSGPRVDAAHLALLPGVVDCHAHVNEPGRTEWEGFTTATQAAAAGGITTLVDMPLNSIPATTTVSALSQKAAAARGKCHVDYGFWGGVVPGNTGELAGMVGAGALGFKAFLIPSGVDEFPHVGRAELEQALPVLASLGVPLLVHAELDLGANTASGGGEGTAARDYRTYLGSRPRAWENEAVRLMVDLCRRHRCRVHVVHLSSAEALEDISRAKQDGLPFTVETCPHYLTFAAEEVPDGATWFKCAPPIREAENRERLWEAVKSGLIDFVVSDHSPCTPALKKVEAGDFLGAWGGIASLQFSLPAVWTGMKRRGLGLAALAGAMCERTSAFLGQASLRGKIARGAEANFVLFDPEAQFTPQVADVLHRHPLTPYAGQALFGQVVASYLRGEAIYRSGQAFSSTPAGRRIP